MELEQFYPNKMIKKINNNSLRIVSILILLGAIAVAARLFVLQVLDYKYYSTLALDSHEIYKQLHPQRGNVFMQDTRVGKEYPVAINKKYYLVYAVPRDVPESDIATTTNFISRLFNFDKQKSDLLLEKLLKRKDPYEPIAKKIPEEEIKKIQESGLRGINFVAEEYRYSPEGILASGLLGFARSSEDGNLEGNYGIEGYWDQRLSGKSGFLAGERGALGSLIPTAGRIQKLAEDGVDLLLTVDRNLQYQACDRLQKGFEEFKARSASLVVLNSRTGAILAMCSLPDFDPNNYSDVKDVANFNNTSIFTPYEPGSVFKPIVMSVALDMGLVNPFTVFTDSGERIINGHKIHNALNKKYGTVTMTEVLENSINTGMIWVAEKIGQTNFKDYMDKFGFGKKTGIELDTEAQGDVVSFGKSAEIYLANGSFGQGFTATPIQIAAAYAALANGGKMPRPYIVDEVRNKNGKTEKTDPETVESVISATAGKLITGMLISVVENGHGKIAKLDNYYIAAKTGTAQIAKGGKYTEDSNHTFVGFFPASAPEFVLLVKYEAPDRNWAESTAAPVFKDVAKFILDYYGVPRDKK